MKDQSDDKATTIKSTPVEQSKPSKDELSDSELNKATGGVVITKKIEIPSTPLYKNA